MVASSASAPNLLGVSDRRALSDASAVRESDDVRALEPERVEHPDQISGGDGHRERARRAGRAPVATDVVGEHPMPVR